MKTIKTNTVRQMLRDRITYQFTQSDMASELNVSSAFVSQVLSGEKKPSKTMREWLGIGDVKMID
jgi:transcriptional regulator with XRE-family HTH domain